ncbi:Probable manganese-transporting ATPase PDR2 (Protein MALE GAMETOGENESIS IMPAIRED ANTHERS) (Protein PHOSPHATE DEFICIENCY RESPONSE 2) [Durusdinium trenchii]|uniref:Probable manganese-transporting ATPase PDR2 (Protein MALE GAMETOGENESIS IMPAIRED ANTHERS) (Protein PHOSPHATE DEFICIENCY RESPONSE 2) n=1 Tax=Durusdinium trenchii TaxID=1381693 RepID=A0ABP0I4J9_9DINO
MKVVINDNCVDKAWLLKDVAWARRLDVTPFAVAYVALGYVMVENGVLAEMLWSVWTSAAVAAAVATEEGSASQGNGSDAAGLGAELEAASEVSLGTPRSEWEMLGWYAVVVGLVALHAATLLVGFWSVQARSWLRFRHAKSLEDARFVCVVPSAHCGSPGICKLRRVKERESEDIGKSKRGPRAVDLDLSSTWFEFQRQTYSLGVERDGGALTFEPRDFPTGLEFGEYLGWGGHATLGSTVRALAKWGRNEFDIPFPSLQELFVEHALSPFFLFQVLCVALWCLDEYWYYSVFTLIMLVMFELTVCKQRQQNLGILRGMRHPPFPIWVFRESKWNRVMSNELLPGDICSIVRFAYAHSMYAGRGASSGDEDQALVPCDMLLLRGSCVVNEAMLTGESVPKMKESVLALIHGDKDQAKQPLDMHDSAATTHLLLGGTKIMQHADEAEDVEIGEKHIPPPPDGGCLGFVLRTGFSTSQGSLMRTILFSTERVTVGNAETFVFILILLFFAVIASAFVLVEGLKNEKQSRWKLFLHCTMIVTSVVPPELPMELSLAVNTSLARLYKLAIFCTEPYRIPAAGKLDVCCFDKTGTLTSDAYVVQGVATDMTDATAPLSLPEELSQESVFVLASCHQLVRLEDKVEGDPMEQAAVKAINWGMKRDGRMVPRTVKAGKSKVQIRILHRHPFSSNAKRMSAYVAVDWLTPASSAKGSKPKVKTEVLVVCKGAPEALQPLFEKAPANYERAFRGLMAKGARVLALGTKRIKVPGVSTESLKKIPREVTEQGLSFAGLLVLDCPLKDDTAGAIDQLVQAGHDIAIVTGDNALTACDVGRRLKIVDEDVSAVLTLQPGTGARQNALEWVNLDPRVVAPEHDPIPLQPATLGDLVGKMKKQLVVTGPMLEILERNAGSQEGFAKTLQMICPNVVVFARVSPRHKELILAALQAAGLHCLMCGDGTNDVGALKQADIGVSIINAPDYERAMERARDRVTNRLPEQVLDRMTAAERIRVELQAMEAEQQGSSVVQLGDASIASPFTSKTTSILSTVHIVRQGRCTLVTTIQMYKILALNCLISAYSLSSLYLFGVKQGDTQATIAGLLIAGLFMFVSWAEPLEELSKERPVSRIFCTPVIMSLVGQLAVHFAALFAVLHLTLPFVEADAEEMDPDADFKPNVINTAVFLVGLCMQCNVFGTNYRGYPFMQSLLDNKPFHRILLATWALGIFLALDVVPEAQEYFELVSLPEKDNYRTQVVAVLLADTAGSWLWEFLVRKLCET